MDLPKEKKLLKSIGFEVELSGSESMDKLLLPLCVVRASQISMTNVRLENADYHPNILQAKQPLLVIN